MTDLQASLKRIEDRQAQRREQARQAEVSAGLATVGDELRSRFGARLVALGTEGFSFGNPELLAEGAGLADPAPHVERWCTMLGQASGAELRKLKRTGRL